DGGAQRLIRTVHGRGFRFIGEVTDVASTASSPEQSEAASVHDIVAIGPSEARPVIAVLPFVNLSDDAEQTYFSEAVTADIVANLSKQRWLDVIATTAMIGPSGKPPDARQLARELGVTYGVEGSVRRAADRIRVAAQLRDVATSVNL